jgi:hypothetical protein
MSIRSLLRRWHVLDPFGFDEIKEAETENALRENEIAISRAETSNRAVKEAQLKLRASIRTALSSVAQHDGTDQLAQLVHDMRSSGQKHHQGK